MTNAPLLILIGFGPGNGLGIARAFGAAGYRLALLSRSPAKHAALMKDIEGVSAEARAFAADAGDATSLSTALAKVAEEMGPADVLIYNAFAPTFTRASALPPESLAADLKVNVVGALASVQAVLPTMRGRARGTILFTGGGWALQPFVDAASVGIGKAALRNLALVLGEELRGSGVRVGTLTILGAVRPGTGFAPEKIGEAFLAYARRDDNDFPPESMFGGE